VTGAWHSGRRQALCHDFDVLVEDGGPSDLVAHQLLGFPSLAGTASSSYRIGPSAGGWALWFDGDSVVQDVTLRRVVGLLGWHLNQTVVERSSPAYTMLHAAAAARDGLAVVLAAPMEHGKTTTVTGLVRAGFDYLTDEAVAIDPETLLIDAYAKPLTIDKGSWSLFPELRPPALENTASSWWVQPDEIRPHAVVRQAAPALVVLPHYTAGSATVATQLGQTEAVMRLAESTFDFRGRPHRNLGVLARLVRRCPAYHLAIGDLDEAVRAVDSLLEEVRCAA
jgi:hypothetical protein